MAKLDLALVHYPVMNRRGEEIGSAVTNLDVHDIARACRTYGVDRYYVVTPFADQQRLVAEIVDHWRSGYGATANPDRGSALATVEVAASVEDVVEAAQRKWGEPPLLIATGAQPRGSLLSFAEARQRLQDGTPLLILFGTGWGLAERLVRTAACSLPPIDGGNGYNHLSVRAAAAIVLDRLCGERVSG